MGRSRANWVIDLSFGDGNEDLMFGPYSEREARKTLKQIERWYQNEERITDQEIDLYISCYPISKWSKSEHGPAAPKRPQCPECDVKLSVWHSHVSDSIYGRCPNCEEEHELGLDKVQNLYYFPANQ
jgi:hypothetical protein